MIVKYSGWNLKKRKQAALNDKIIPHTPQPCNRTKLAPQPVKGYTTRHYTCNNKYRTRTWVLSELIERIEVYHAEKIDGVHVQHLAIHYHCIGEIVIPVLSLPMPEVSIQTRKRDAMYLPLIRQMPTLLSAGVEINNYRPVRVCFPCFSSGVLFLPGVVLLVWAAFLRCSKSAMSFSRAFFSSLYDRLPTRAARLHSFWVISSFIMGFYSPFLGYWYLRLWHGEIMKI